MLSSIWEYVLEFFSGASDDIIDLENELLESRPVVDRPAYFNRMARSIRMLSDDVIEIRAYWHDRARLVLYSFGLFILAMVSVDILTEDGRLYLSSLARDWRMITDYDAFIAEEYDLATISNNPVPLVSANGDMRAIMGEERYTEVYGAEYRPPSNREEYIESFDKEFHQSNARDNIIGFSFFMMLPLSMLLLGLLLPKQAPLRVDRTRRVAYTIIRRELAIVGFGPDTAGYTLHFTCESAPPRTFLSPSSKSPYAYGPAIAQLYGTKSGKNRVMWMGSQPPTNGGQNVDISSFAWLFTQTRLDSSLWIHLLRWRHFMPGDILRIFGRISFRRMPDLDNAHIQEEIDRLAPNAMSYSGDWKNGGRNFWFEPT